RPLPTLPASVPVDAAGALIRRRPDVRRAERQLAASSAKIGEALTAYFPQVTLLGNIGMAATSPGDLGRDAVNSVVAPFLRWSIFDFGGTRAKVEQARAGNAARLAAYEGTVLAALQDANGALARFGAARQQALAADKAAASADRSAALLQQRYAAGASSLIDALDVQRQQASAQDSALQAHTQVLLRYVALQKSLGLGWAAPEAPASAPAPATAQ
ncbi:MAG: TolC family protein, partial [Xanthomonas sp.]